MKKGFMLLGIFSYLISTPLRADVYVGTDQITASPVVKEKVFKRGDFVLVKISELSQSSYQRDKSGKKETDIAAKLANWVRLKTKKDGSGHTKVLKPAALDEPEIEFESDTRFANNAADKYKASLVEDITAQIKDVRPNGNFYIEGHKELRENGNIRRVSFSGEISKADVDAGGEVLSKKIYNMKIEINEEGERRQQTKRNLLQQFVLWLWPF